VRSPAPTLLVLPLIACSPSNERLVAAASSAVRPAASASAAAGDTCPRDAAKLDAYLGILVRDGKVNAETYPAPGDRYQDRRLPSVELAPGEDPPRSAPYLAYVTLDRRTLRYGEESVSVEQTGKVRELFKRVADSGQVGGFGTESSYLQSFNLLAGARESWRDVAATVESARDVGFTQVHLLVGAKSALSAPPPTAFTERLEKIATAQDRMPWQREHDLRDAFAIEARDCPALVAPLSTPGRGEAITDNAWTDFVEKAPEALGACVCKIAPGTVEAFAWHFMGRHWGPTTSAIELDLGTHRPESGKPVLEPVRAPAATPFGQMIAQLKAIPPSRAVQLIATPSP
jgi:hypothetical protein